MKLRILSKTSVRLPHAAAIAAMLSSASAASITWDANGATALQTDGAGVWLTASQWWDGLANVNWTSGDDAVFGNAGAGGAVTLASPTTVNSRTFNSFTGTYTLGTAAQSITLNNGITKNTATGAAIIISPITLGASQSWANNSAGLLTIGTGAVGNAGFLLTLGGSGNTTVTSVISGAGGLAKSDAGLATVSAVNSYTGTTNVNAGKLVINGSISTSSLTTVASGATLGGIGIVGKTIINGTFAVGNSPGTMIFTDTLGLNGTTIMESI